jgi:MYND finger
MQAALNEAIAKEVNDHCMATKPTRPHLTRQERRDVMEKYGWGAFSAMYGRECFNCNRGGCSKVCTRCCLSNYCDRECQVAHWQTHKKTCGNPVKSMISDSDMADIRVDIERSGWAILYHHSGNMPVTIDPVTGNVYELVTNQDVITPHDADVMLYNNNPFTGREWVPST